MMTRTRPSPIDPLALTRALVRCPSVTPEEGGALDVLQKALEDLGFVCARQVFAAPGTPAIDNLYARFGTAAPHFSFAGHSDVVPVGDGQAWSADPFKGEMRAGHIIGRGAVDMKGAIAAFVAAAARFIGRPGEFKGSISLLITGDEEGPAINGTVKLLQWLKDQGETIDHCLVGEPTNVARLGDMVKIGRRGSLNGTLTVKGVQGHVAYPDRADNPIPAILDILRVLTDTKLDAGNDYFQPSNLEIVSVDVGNRASNVIPGEARARFNIRFNDAHTGASLSTWLHSVCADVLETRESRYELDISVSGEAFVTQPGPFTQIIENAIVKKCGVKPEFSTGGGTSDARFIKDLCPVAEFGLVGATMHKVDEQAAVQDICDLSEIYGLILEEYFTP